MKKVLGKLLRYAYFGVFGALLMSHVTLAYLDPGTVTYVVSMIAGLVIAGGAALAIFRRKIKLFFQNLGKKKTAGEEAPADDTALDFNPMDEVVDPMAEDDQPEA